MNREILFRGRRTDNGEWVEGHLLYGSDKPYIVTWFGGDVAYCWGCGIPHLDYFEVNPATVGQYTGLADKNGKRIFEGDVLQDAEGPGEVFWMPEHCAFMVRTRDDEGCAYHYLQGDGQLKKSEVIGTTHDKEAPHDRTTD